MTQHRPTLLLALLIAGTVNLVACGAKHSVTRVSVGEVGKGQGVYYALPKTIVEIVIPVTRTEITPTELAKYANGPIDGAQPAGQPNSDVGPIVAAVSFKLGEPRREVKQYADEDALYYIDPRRDYAMFSQELVVELSERGYIVSTKSVIDDKSLEYAVKTIETTAKVAGLVISPGAGIRETDPGKDDKLKAKAKSLRERLSKIRVRRDFYLLISQDQYLDGGALDTLLKELKAEETGLINNFRTVLKTTWEARIAVELSDASLSEPLLYVAEKYGVIISDGYEAVYPMPDNFNAHTVLNDDLTARENLKKALQEKAHRNALNQLKNILSGLDEQNPYSEVSFDDLSKAEISSDSNVFQEEFVRIYDEINTIEKRLPDNARLSKLATYRSSINELAKAIEASIEKVKHTTIALHTNSQTPWQSNALPEETETGFVYRMPVWVDAHLMLNDRAVPLESFSVSQLGPMVALPMKLGRNSTYDVAFHEKTGALKKLTATATPPAANAIGTLGTSAESLLKAQAAAEAAKRPAAQLKSEVELLDLQFKKLQLEQQLLELEAASIASP